MGKLSTYALAVAVCLGTTAMLAISNRTVAASTSNETRFAADGAFRDGLYLGRLAAEAGTEPHIARGRWATLGDRALFSAGYQEGYRGSLASR